MATIVVLFVALAAVAARAGDLSRGISPADGQVLHASDLDNLIDLTSINSSFVTGKPLDTTPFGTDLVPIWSPALNGYQKLQLSSLVSAPSLWAAIYTNGTVVTNLFDTTTNDQVLIWTYGTNTANPTGTNTTPQLGVLPLSVFGGSGVPFKNYAYGTNTYFTNSTVTNFNPWASMVPPASYSSSAYSSMLFTNVNNRSLLILNYVQHAGSISVAEYGYLTNYSQTNLVVVGETDNATGTLYGTVAVPLNPNDIFRIYSSGDGGTFTILNSWLYGF